MNHPRNAPTLITAASGLAVALLVLLSIPTAPAHAQAASEVEELRREVRQLRSQVQMLRSALSDAAEADAQKASALTRALKAIPTSADAPASDRARPVAAAPTPVIVPPPAPPAPVAHNSRRGGEGSKKAPEGPPPAGIVRGKVAVPKGEPVSYVYVENVLAPAVRDQKHVIEQVGKRFVPAWAVIQRGTVISFPNRDNIYHNVFSLSSGNTFDLGLYSAGESKSHTFNEAGEVEIYCNIHPQMAASALVVPNRLFAKVKGDGTFDIGGVPVGKRKIVAWAPGSRLAATWVDVEAGEAAQVELKLEPKASSHKNKAGQQYGSYE